MTAPTELAAPGTRAAFGNRHLVVWVLFAMARLTADSVGSVYAYAEQFYQVESARDVEGARTEQSRFEAPCGDEAFAPIDDDGNDTSAYDDRGGLHIRLHPTELVDPGVSDDPLRLECRLRVSTSRPFGADWPWLGNLALLAWFVVIPLVYVGYFRRLPRPVPQPHALRALFTLAWLIGGDSYSYGACCFNLTTPWPMLGNAVLFVTYGAIGSLLARRKLMWLAVVTSAFGAFSVLGWLYFRYSFVFHTYSAFILELVLGVFVWAEHLGVAPTISADPNEPSTSIAPTRASLLRQRIGLGLILVGSLASFLPQVAAFFALGLIGLGFALFLVG